MKSYKKQAAIDMTAMIIISIIGVYMLIHEMLVIHRKQYKILCIYSGKSCYGLEVKDISITEQLRDSVLVVKSNMQQNIQNQQPQLQHPIIQEMQSDDKIRKLTELSHLYEQGMIQQQEFEQLKNELLSQ